jgi:hypothetical protein
MDFQKKPLGVETRESVEQPVTAQQPPVVQQPVVTEKKYPRRRNVAWRIIVTTLLIVATGLLVVGWLYVQDLYAQLDKKDSEIVALQMATTAKDKDSNVVDNAQTSIDDKSQQSRAELAASTYYCVIENFGCDKVTATVTKFQSFVADGASKRDGFAIVSAGNSAGLGIKIYVKSVDGLQWTVIYDGQNTPSQAIVDKFAIPKDFM